MPETGISFVVATKDRPAELLRMWRSLCGQTVPPAEVVIVDAGETAPAPVREMERDGLPLRRLRAVEASATRQRNQGVAAARTGLGLIGFLDDDVVLEKNAVAEMLRFWAQADGRVGGAAFNMLNHPPLSLRELKRTPFVEAAGLYARRGGAVSRSGFQTMIGRVETTTYTDWLPTGASVWRREVFDRFRFDEWFRGYSYLEDLDFSYRAGKAYKLAVVAPAGYRHLPAASGRGGGYAFGLREVVNRLYFAGKHREFSRAACRAALAVRFLMNAALAARERDTGYFGRACGNLVGLAMSLGGMIPSPRPGAAARDAGPSTQHFSPRNTRA